MAFDIVFLKKVSFTSVSQIGGEGKLQALHWKEEKTCDKFIDKEIKIIQSLVAKATKTLNQGYGSAIISVQLKNKTGLWDYTDRPYVTEGMPCPQTKGMSIIIDDISCDIRKSLVYDLEKSNIVHIRLNHRDGAA